MKKLAKDNSKIKSIDLLRMLDKKEMNSSISSTSSVRRRKLSAVKPRIKRMLLNFTKSVFLLKSLITVKYPSRTDWTILKRVKSNNRKWKTTDKRSWKSKSVKLKV